MTQQQQFLEIYCPSTSTVYATKSQCFYISLPPRGRGRAPGSAQGEVHARALIELCRGDRTRASERRRATGDACRPRTTGRFRQLARGDSLISRAKRAKRARRLAPVVQHVRILLELDVFLDVAYDFGKPLALQKDFAPVSVANEYIFERSPQYSVGGTSAVSDLNLLSVRKFAAEYSG